VCEDDLEFLAPRAEIEHAVRTFLDSPDLDVLSLSGRARGGAVPLENGLRLVVGLVGRGCYIVKPHMVEPLFDVFEKGIPKLMAGKRTGKGDLMWGRLQKRRHFFAAPHGTLAQQGSGFSDIEGRELGPR
jgi:hypothetical protein